VKRGPTPKAAPRRGAWQPQLAVRGTILFVAFAVVAVVILGRAFQLQALDHERWTRVAEEQHRTRVPLPARRGAIYDRDGVPLALSHETFRVSVAPRELSDPRAAQAALREALGLSRAEAARATDRSRRWVVLPGRFTAEQRRQLAGTRGLHFERSLDRFYPQGDIAREVTGVVSGDDRPLGGVEQQLDALLRGEPGYSVMRRDARGRELPALSLPMVPPRDGASVHLTIDLDIQEIADEALRHAIRETGASGGDLLIVDPHTGDLLAAVSQRVRTPGRTLAAITEPYEPGSTLKPFLIASLMAEGRVRLNEIVNAEGGRWAVAGRRTPITDTQPYEDITVAHALRVSSNVAVAKLVSRFRPEEQYASLRDFGFGAATGIEYPSESSGRLRRPAAWTQTSNISLAMGYEISVTPLQLAMAYSALANGGTLYEPRLLREVRGADGRVLYRSQPAAVRRVLPAEVTRQLTEVLVAVVDSGTATRASMGSFEVAGKTGTARRTGAGGRYVQGSYTSSFVGYFPARDPQLTIYVKLDEPRGAYYGGLTAAPVTRETLQGILAARTATLSGARLLATRSSAAAPTAQVAARRWEPPQGGGGPYVFPVGSPGDSMPAAAAPRPIAVPDLQGLAMRDAARRLHALGFSVRLSGGGEVVRTEPAAGVGRPAGDTVHIFGADRR
jgi:cell division protein FtsI (penicillin-binding protein 3)